LILLLAGLALAQEADCPDDPRNALVGALQASSVAWSSLDGKSLDAAMVELREAVACLDEPADLDLVLAVHRAHARHAWTTYDAQASARAWLAVRDLAPTWTDAYESDVPKDHPVRELWDERPHWTTELDQEPPGGWLVDGTRSREVPMDRAFMLQAVDRRGAIAYSAWHLTAAEVPQSPWRDQHIKTVRARWTVVSAIVAAGGVGLLGGAYATRQTMKDPATPDRRLLALQRQSNMLGVAGATTVGASALTMGLLWGVKW